MVRTGRSTSNPESKAEVEGRGLLSGIRSIVRKAREVTSDVQESFDSSKVSAVIIGEGGVGKTTLLNGLTGSSFRTSDAGDDCTLFVQGSTTNGSENIQVCDTPGVLEDKPLDWWTSLTGLPRVFAVVYVTNGTMHRNSSRVLMTSILKFCNAQGLPVIHVNTYKDKYRFPKNIAIFHRLLWRDGNSNDVSEIQRQILLARDKHVTGVLCSPIDLCAKVQKMEGQLSELKRLLTLSRDVASAIEVLDSEQLTGKLRRINPETGDSKSRVNGFHYHLLAWLPGAGNYWLYRKNRENKRADDAHKLIHEGKKKADKVKLTIDSVNNAVTDSILEDSLKTHSC